MYKTWQLNKINPQIKIAFLEDNVNKKEDEHGHEFMEIEYITKGKVIQVINGERFECSEGDFLFFYVGDIHSYESVGEASIINLIFDPKLFEYMALNRYFPIDKRIESVVKLPKGEKKRITEILNIMNLEYNKKKEGFICVLQSLLQSIICILLRYGYRKKAFDDRIVKIIDMIDEKCNVSITEIARGCGFCNNHVSRIFKEATGIPIKEYINKKRIMKAFDLIQKTDMSIERIMETIDMSNRTHFYYLFKKYTGKTPGELR